MQLLTADQVAAQLGVTRRFVRRLVAERRITFHRVGRFIRFDPADVDACVAAGRVEPIHARPVRSS
ncbi:MAG: excisionase family DNA-binding protein [Acidimicrobiia bacterium]|nr:excisionase family DNA-binding protein [Acidimicrobiia bacterium]